jgi:RNA polymerase sigma factor (sigma-70 family)
MYQPIVFVVDDDPGIRKSLSLWLGFRNLSTRQFETAEAFLNDANPDTQGVAIIDYRLGDMDGLLLQEGLINKGVKIPLVFLTGHGSVHLARSAMKAGAFDFLEKPVDNDHLISVITDALKKDEERWSAEQQLQQIADRIGRLTAREREALTHVVEGRPNREIAERMSISPRTVEVYKARIMDKMDVRSTAELVRVILKLDA